MKQTVNINCNSSYSAKAFYTFLSRNIGHWLFKYVSRLGGSNSKKLPICDPYKHVWQLAKITSTAYIFSTGCKHTFKFLSKTRNAKYLTIFPYPRFTLVLTVLMSLLKYSSSGVSLAPLNGAKMCHLTG